MSTSSISSAAIPIRQASLGQDGREPVRRAAENAQKQMSDDDEKRSDNNVRGAKRKDYKGFVAGVFSGIAKLSGE
jgi:hypothetical protein